MKPVLVAPSQLMAFASKLHSELFVFERFQRDVAALHVRRRDAGGLLIGFTGHKERDSLVCSTDQDDISDLTRMMFGGALQAWLTRWVPFDIGSKVLLLCTGHDYAKRRVHFGRVFIEDAYQPLSPWFDCRQDVYITNQKQMVNPSLLQDGQT